MAVLSDPQYAEMFWDSYHIEAIVEDSEERRRILTDPEWWRYSHNGRLVYRSRALGMVADGAYEAGSVFDEDGRVVMRGLYLFVPEWANGPNMFERAMLWLRWLRGRSWSPRGE